jgi:hypothetical protein
MKTKLSEKNLIRSFAYVLLSVGGFFLLLTILALLNYGTKAFSVDMVTIIIGILCVVFLINGIGLLIIFPEYIPLDISGPIPRGSAPPVPARGKLPSDYYPSTEYYSQRGTGLNLAKQSWDRINIPPSDGRLKP